MAATARCIEKGLNSVAPDGSGGWNWNFDVLYVGLDGTPGALYPDNVTINSGSNMNILTATARKTAYVNHGNSISGAANTMALLLPVDLLTWASL